MQLTQIAEPEAARQRTQLGARTRAELRGRREGPAALGARPGQRRGALFAKLRPHLVLVLAPGAFHRPDLPERRPVSFLPRQEWTERTRMLAEGQGSPG